MRLKIFNKYVNLCFVPFLGKDTAADCDPPDAKDKTIRITSGQPVEHEVEYLIHEIFHFSNWSASEEHTQQYAEDLTKILFKLYKISRKEN